MIDTPRPDFLARRAGRPLLAWAIVLSGGVALLLAGHAAWSVQSEFEATATPAFDPATPRRHPSARGREPIRADSGDLEAARSAHRLAAALSYPWQAALTSLEAATPQGVQWLVLEHVAESGEVRLEGRATDASTALHLVDALSTKPGWRDVALVRLQRAEGRDPAAAALPLQFAVEAHLEATALVTDGGAGGG